MYIFWYVWCLNGWAHICEKKKWKQVTSPSVFALEHHKVSLIRRVFLHWHTAKIETLPCACQLAHGKDWDFAVCLPDATRQIRSLCRVPSVNGTRQTRRQRPPAVTFPFFCRVRFGHSAKPALPTKVSPSVFCRVPHLANLLPSAKWSLPSASGTRQRREIW